jgi:hypothetical protein
MGDSGGNEKSVHKYIKKAKMGGHGTGRGRGNKIGY